MHHTPRSRLRALATAMLGAISMALALPTVLSAQTFAQSDNGFLLYGFGVPSFATVGQTFVAPVNGTLSSFSFWLGNEADAPDAITVDAEQLRFRAYVMAWGGNATTGEVLYASDITNGPTTLNQQLSFTPIGLDLSAGSTYVAFLSASGLFAENPAFGLAAIGLSDDGSLGGRSVFLDNGDDLSCFTTVCGATWLEGTEFSAPQLQFAVVVQTVPEPASLTLLLIAVAGFLMTLRRRRAS